MLHCMKLRNARIFKELPQHCLLRPSCVALRFAMLPCVPLCSGRYPNAASRSGASTANSLIKPVPSNCPLS